MPFAQRVNRRVGHLAEILPEKLANQTRLVANHGQRGVIAHRTNGFLAILDHWRQDHLNIFQRHARRNLPFGQLGTRPWRVGYIGRRQIINCAKAANQCGIVMLCRDPVFQFIVAVQRALIQIHRDHLSRPKAAFFDNRRFGYHHHSGFRPDDQQIIVGQTIAQRPQRVAVNACHRPMAIGHRQCRRAIPWLHHAGHIRVHIGVRFGHIGV